MLKGFKDFIMRGNVVDLAVGVTIGAAFATLVSSFSDSFLKPLISAIGFKGDKLPGTIPLGSTQNAITYGAFLSTVIGFVITAAVVYFLVVLPMNKFAERRKRGEEPEPKAPSEEVKLLMEIRDALVAQRGAGATPVPRTAEEQENRERAR